MSNLCPIFLLSLPRSGSTLLQRLLAAHPKISTLSEPWLLLPLCYALKPAGVFSEYDHGTCHKAISDFIQQLPNKEYDFYHAISDLVQTLYEKASNPEALYFLDKTPRYHMIIPEIAKIFPNSKFIFLFRNPLQIMASFVETWTNGKLRLERYYIDLYRGPKLLAEGYEGLKENSIRINFDDLVQKTEEVLGRIFGYLDLEYDSSIIEKFSRIELNSQFGDREGYYKYSQIESQVVEKWKKVFATKYRKKFAKKYISKFSSHTLSVFGYNRDMLVKLIDDIQTVKGGLFFDRLDFMISNIFRIFEVPLFLRKLRLFLLNNEPFTIHR